MGKIIDDRGVVIDMDRNDGSVASLMDAMVTILGKTILSFIMHSFSSKIDIAINGKSRSALFTRRDIL